MPSLSIYFKDTEGILSPTLMLIFLSFPLLPGVCADRRIGRDGAALKPDKTTFFVREL